MILSFKPADILLFCGEGHISNFIRFVTCSKYSHIGICAEFEFPNHKKDILLFESTSLNDIPCAITGKNIKGVQAQYPLDRIHRYKGKVWLSRINSDWELELDESIHLTSYLSKYIGCSYDTSGAFLSRIRQDINWTPEDLQKLFCSELTVGALKRIERFPLTNSSKWTPGSAFKQLRKIGMYQKPELIKG